MITLDAVSKSAVGAGVTTRSWSHTVGSGSNKKLLALVQARDAGTSDYDVASVTFNTSETLTAIRADEYTAGGTDGGQLKTGIYELANPTSTTANILVTFNGTVNHASGYGISLFGASQSAAEASNGGNAATSTPSVSVTTVANNAWVFASVYSKIGTDLSVGSGQTGISTQNGVNGGGDRAWASYKSNVSPAGSTTMNFTHTGTDDYCMTVASIAPAVTVTSNDITKSMQYCVKKTLDITKSLKYCIKIVNNDITKSLRYAVKPVISITKSLKYCVKVVNNTTTKSMQYAIKIINNDITKSMRYAVKPVISITKSLQYTIKTVNHDVTKSMRYAIKIANNDITKSLAYSVKPVITITKSLQYTIKTVNHDVTKSLRYAIKIANNDITKSLRYVVKPTISITKSLQYCVKVVNIDITKSMRYTVKKVIDVTKSLQYTVKPTISITKSMKYTVIKAIDITKSMTYALPSPNTHSLDLELSSSQYASITDASQTGLDLNSDFTFETWIKLEQLPSTAGTTFTILAKNSLGNNQRAYQLFINTADNKLYCDFYQDGAATNWTRFSMDEAFDADDVGVWIHIAAVADISVPSITFYKDAVSKAGTSVNATATSINNSTAAFVVGARNNNGTPELYADMKIDDIRVWSDIRTAQEIEDNRCSELDGNEANLVAYWKLNNDYLDETSNNNDLTASGSPVFSTDYPSCFNITTVDITKSMQYCVKVVNNTVTKSMRYAVKPVISITKSMQYTIIKAQTITKSLQYVVARLTSTLRDTFDSGFNASLWSDWGGTKTRFENSRFEIDNSTSSGLNYYGIDSLTTYDLTTSAISIQVVDAGNQSITGWGVWPLQLKKDSTNNLNWSIQQGTLKATKKVAGTDTDLYTVTYNSTTHKYLRIRESGGTVYFDTSADGATWTNRATTSTPFSITQLTVQIFAGTYQAGASTTAKFDNVNYIKEPVDITKSLQYTVVRPASDITKSMRYAIAIPIAITKSMKYVLYAPITITKSMRYAIVKNIDITKSLQYAISKAQAITLSMRYAIAATARNLFTPKEVDGTTFASKQPGTGRFTSEKAPGTGTFTSKSPGRASFTSRVVSGHSWISPDPEDPSSRKE